MIMKTLLSGFVMVIWIGLVSGPGICADTDLLRNRGAGAYTDASVLGQDSFFSINPIQVSCGVAVGGMGAPDGLASAFSMEMYSFDIDSYNVDHATGTITASGRMRSITIIKGKTVEDVHHLFTAIAVDNSAKPDRFDINFKTPFWNPSNPLCTPSTVIPGDCRFGGFVYSGEVTVSP